MIIYIKNQKGGVGKSTITKNLASGLEKLENKTAIITFDAQNDSLRMLGHLYEDGDKGFKHFVKTGEDVKIHVRENLWYYPLETDIFANNMKTKIKNSLKKLENEYDVILIDGAPASNNILDKVALELSDKFIVPIQLNEASVRGISRLLDNDKGSDIDVIVPNFFGNTKVNKEYYEALKDHLEESTINIITPIKRSSIEETLAEKGKSIFETESQKSIDLRERYLELIEVLFNEENS